jgi:hypothetical protein
MPIGRRRFNFGGSNLVFGRYQDWVPSGLQPATLALGHLGHSQILWARLASRPGDSQMASIF